MKDAANVVGIFLLLLIAFTPLLVMVVDVFWWILSGHIVLPMSDKQLCGAIFYTAVWMCLFAGME